MMDLAALKNLKITSFEDAVKLQDSLSSQELMMMNENYNAHNYKAMAFVARRGEGVYFFDDKGQKFFDFLACYGAVNQGHNHPKIVEAVQKQITRLALSSRAFYSDMLAVYSKFIADFFGYQRVMPMNSGLEGVETAVKLCRKWAYNVKKIPEPEAKIVMVKGCFWGRSITACSTSSDPECYSQYGPYTPGFIIIPYDDVEALRKQLETEKNICAFVVEPIQGEAGCIVPSKGYLKQAFDLCKKHNVLFVADEIQSGLGRTGRMLCCDHENVRPDLVVLGKALSGGVYPVSAVLSDDEVMLTIKPGQHGSTYGGNPLGCAAAIAALCVLRDEKLPENATKMGEIFRNEIAGVAKLPFVDDVRGVGLMNAVQIKKGFSFKAIDICAELCKRRVLCKPTHEINIRFTPPLVINESQVKEACGIINAVFNEFAREIAA